MIGITIGTITLMIREEDNHIGIEATCMTAVNSGHQTAILGMTNENAKIEYKILW